MRAVATKRARPALASQAENARRRMGEGEKAVASSCSVQRAKAMNSDSIMPSKQRRAERRWVRWKARPVSPKTNVEEKVKCAGVIRKLWVLTRNF